MKRQTGAAAVFAAIALLAMLVSTMLAIDIGRTYFARRDLQKQATVAALDASRLVSGCSLPGESLYDPPTDAELTTFVNERLTQNGVDVSALDSAVVEAGDIQTYGSGGTGTQGNRALGAGSGQARAVRVTLSEPLPSPLLPLMPSTAGKTMTVSATATQLALGSFYVGSGLLNLDGGIVNGLLSGLLGGNVSLSVADYNGLASADVSLAALATAVGLDVADLSDPLALSTQTPALSDVIDGLAGSLSGEVSGTVIDTLQTLGAAAASGSNPDVPIGDLLSNVDGTAANAPFINLFDLIVALGAASQADPGGLASPIELPVSLAVPGVATLKAFVRIGQPPQFSGMQRAGEGEAHSQQIQVMVRLSVDALSTVTSALNLLLGGGLIGSIDAPPINLGLDLDVAKADAYLDSIQCPRSADPTLAVGLSAKPTLADLKLGTFAGSAADAPAISNGFEKLLGVTINLLGGLLADIKVNVYLDGPVQATVGNDTPTVLNPVTHFTAVTEGGQTRYWAADNPVSGENPQTVGSTTLLSSAVSSLFSSLNITASDPDHPDESTSVCLLLLVCVPAGDIVNAVLNPVTSLLGTVLTGVGGIVDSLLDPLLNALGIKLGTATVTMTAVSLDQPVLITTELPPASP